MSVCNSTINKHPDNTNAEALSLGAGGILKMPGKAANGIPGLQPVGMKLAQRLSAGVVGGRQMWP